MRELTLVTSNKDKAREIEQILKMPLAVADIDLDEIQGLDLETVAYYKLDQAYEKVQKPVIIDDVSVVIHAWNTFPGPLIKWVLQASSGTPAMLLKMLEGEKEREATATLVIGFMDGKSRKLFYGQIHGVIGEKIEGENGFGWDKVFIPEGYANTLASLPIDEKNAISHRRKALDAFKDFILDYNEV